ncbi:MAG: phosphoenolpyruvate carboxykinase (GTP) [Planctomycetota bacterium]
MEPTAEEKPAVTSDKPCDNKYVRSWADKVLAHVAPDEVVWCDGSDEQQQQFFARGIAEGIFIQLNQEKLPGCYLHRSDPNDVARTEKSTFICTPDEDAAGPTNNWMKDQDAYAMLRPKFEGCMKGRTAYVIPFVMGPIGSPLAKVGVQITDSVYVAASMKLMTRMGQVAWDELGDSREFTKCVHSIGTLDPADRYICHFPYDNTIWSYGSGYGGNALLGKKCMALRIASFLGKRQGWMAEHMLILGAEGPDNNGGREKTYVAAAFPSSCGKTNFAMLVPPKKYLDDGWKVTTVGDDIAWMWVDETSGRLRAINPEAGYFGVVPGTNDKSNPNAAAMIQKNTIFTNVALLADGDVWWEGKTKKPPKECLDWRGNRWTPSSPDPAAHPNSRFTVPMENNPVLDPAADDPHGVEVSAIMFGGRRSNTIPLVYQAFNWVHGVYCGATLGSEGTAAAENAVGEVRRDPMAMLPFVGYNMRDYLVHWFRMRKQMTDCPRIFAVNWFRRDDEGNFMWPGFGENMRVLKWIIDRCKGRAYAYEAPLGWMPKPENIDLDDLPEVNAADFRALERVDVEAFKHEILGQEELLLKLAGDLPKEIIFQRELLISRM